MGTGSGRTLKTPLSFWVSPANGLRRVLFMDEVKGASGQDRDEASAKDA